MYKISEIASFLLKKYPLNKQEEWDNCGLFFNHFDDICKNIVVGLDVTHDLLKQALDGNANFLITHHPIFLNNGAEINSDKKELLEILKMHHIAYLCLHTCFDKAKDGTSYQIIKRLPMVKNIVQNNECEYIFNCELMESIKLKDYVNKINFQDFNKQSIIYDSSLEDKLISNLSLCAGSGSFFVKNAIFDPNIDCYLCGDIKWHDWVDANDNNFPLIDISHASEAVFIDYISELIEKNFNILPVKVFPHIKLVSKD